MNWPDILKFGSRNTLYRIEDPLLDVLEKGDNILGWEGADNLCLYFSPRERQWILMASTPLGPLALKRISPDEIRTDNLPGFIVRWLVEHDTRRGYDVLQVVEDHNAKRDVENAEANHARWAETLPKVREAFKKIGNDKAAESPLFQDAS